MKFRSMSGKPERIASTSGHVIVVPTDDFVELLPHMEAEARALGCISEEIYLKITVAERPPGGTQVPPPPAVRDHVISAKLREMAASNDASFFTKAGFPNKRVLDGMCGFSTTAEEIKAGWDAVSAESEATAKAKEEAEAAAKIAAAADNDGFDDRRPNPGEV